MVKDQLVTAADYVREEDPCIYVSRLTGRGPLGENWIQEYWKECKVTLNSRILKELWDNDQSITIYYSLTI